MACSLRACSRGQKQATIYWTVTQPHTKQKKNEKKRYIYIPALSQALIVAVSQENCF